MFMVKALERGHELVSRYIDADVMFPQLSSNPVEGGIGGILVSATHPLTDGHPHMDVVP